MIRKLITRHKAKGTYLVEVEVHGTEVHLQLGRVLLLLEELLLRLRLLLSFTLLKFFLSLTGFALFFFIFLLLFIITLSLPLT